MAKEEGESVAAVADGITLEAVTLILVCYAEFDATPTLKPERLLINCHPLAGNPHFGCIVINLVKEALHLPQWIFFCLLLCVLSKIKHAHESPEVFPAPDPSDRTVATRNMLVHCLGNELIPKDIVPLEPHRE